LLGIIGGASSSAIVFIILVIVVFTAKSNKNKKSKNRLKKGPINEISTNNIGRNSRRGITVTQTSGNPYSEGHGYGNHGGQNNQGYGNHGGQNTQGYGNPVGQFNQGYHTENELTRADLPQYMSAGPGAGSYAVQGAGSYDYNAGYLQQPQMQVGSNNMNPGGRSGSHQGGLTLGQQYLGGRGSMDSINTHSSDLSFGSAGSFYSNDIIINNPLRSSLKRPKNKETISTSSARSQKSVTIAIGQEQTAV